MNQEEEIDLPDRRAFEPNAALDAEPRQAESKRTRMLVLIGSGLLQLPIWGFAMSYGVLQEHLYNDWTLEGDRSLTGVIGTTANGVMYLAMPFLFALFSRRWARWRQAAALGGTLLACASLLLSTFSTAAWHLLASQGVAAALGGAVVYSTATLSLGEWHSGRHRALAYGIVLSCKNVVGTSCPFLMRAWMDAYGFRKMLRLWTALVGGTSLVGVLLVPPPVKAGWERTPMPTPTPTPSQTPSETQRQTPPQTPPDTQTRTHTAPPLPWHFLAHRSIYFYGLAIALQSSGYGIPQTYLSTYARDIAQLSQASGTLLLALFNAPGIVASCLFGWLSDSRGRWALSAQTVSAIPPLCSAVSALLFWGLTREGGGGGSGSGSGSGHVDSNLVLLILFSVTFGFFSGGYSATWGGMLRHMEREAAEHNEAVDPGMLYGMLNGVRGIGYTGGGFAGMRLLALGPLGGGGGSGDGGRVATTATAAAAAAVAATAHRFGYATSYGPLILFTALSSLLGGWVVLWRWWPASCPSWLAGWAGFLRRSWRLTLAVIQ